ncbi:biotin--[acetyl-CoA-carboxylase] ligase [Agromyces sp. CFH 90414]|uniref:biotin--[biotin carboxyl-carrier protein] ligase n=1 Tax=Agromyces agglutinans TaxID=2662258 RepID=A0A6I2F8F5_9MICO|nr:biotin--[acetyl-CoA-carboxylase] ligase [Agromyces agglutinans]MRG60534.1 biotin--[acetyl-CoA-carboxylase] ligase [Agromyces agglutinans]
MEWERSAEVVPRLEFLEQAGSTNDELRRAIETAEAADWPHGSVIFTDDQTAGRGRLGRTWLAPTGKTLAISLVLRPDGPGGVALPVESFGWLPLIAGAAMTEAVRGAVAAASEVGDAVDEGEVDASGGLEVTLKWPNDVLVSGFKVCGILCELLPDRGAVIVGAGLNLTLDEHDLPTLTSTSLLLATGRRPDADAVLADYLRRLLEMVAVFAAAGGDAAAAGIADRVASLCGTIGSEVRVELPGDRLLVGTAERIDRDGRLIVRDRANDEPQAVAAGDVTHLRY